MLLPPTTRSSGSRRSRQFGHRRRSLRKTATVCRLLGALCVLAALAFAVMAWMHAREVQRKQFFVAKCFGIAAPVLLATGYGLDWWKYRFYGRGGRSPGGANGERHATEASSR